MACTEQQLESRINSQRFHETFRKIIVAFAICASVLGIAKYAHDAYAMGYKHAARIEYNRMLLTFMTGGLSVVMSRCILETETPEEIKSCIKNSTPNEGRSL